MFSRSPRNLVNALIVVYSALIMATVVPSFSRITGDIVPPYYLFVPGYCITSLFGGVDSLIERLFFTIAWGLATLAGVFALESLEPNITLSLNVVIPIITLVVLTYNYFHGR